MVTTDYSDTNPICTSVVRCFSSHSNPPRSLCGSKCPTALALSHHRKIGGLYLTTRKRFKLFLTIPRTPYINYYPANSNKRPERRAVSRNRLSGSTDHLVFSDLVMATSVSAVKGPAGLRSSFSGGWGSSLMGEEQLMLARSVPARVRVSTRPVRPQPMMKNVNEGKGLFAPIVVLTRNIIGKKRFNQFRGKAIALHSQVITEFCKSIGADAKQRQGLIRLAKKNGERLGFLA